MSTIKLFAIRDNKAMVFDKFFFAKNEVDATRIITRLVNDDTQLSMFSNDYDLYRVAEIDHDTGIPKVEEQPVFLMGVNSLKQQIAKEEKNDK